MSNAIARILTALLLAGIYFFAYYCLPAWVLAYIIGIIGLYIFFVEFLPIAPIIEITPKKNFLRYGILHLSICLAFVILIYWALHHTQLLALTIILASAADIGAYTIGKLCGNHKLAPTISPGKTWEGFIGGWCTTAIVLVGIQTWYKNILSLQLLLWTLLFSLGSTVAGLLGDLYISKLKRAAGIKDTGSILPGHGGLLDRCDSILSITWYIFLYNVLVKYIIP
ncbi:MAG TPA: phosphatidate cytidylyltransferase [Candidatus Babeliales bacterium]|jgi:phosphatidate cytidylyltransferase|nr:phosphatidate cytidylyltransferase [Candidatus Babeliales bacterium]